MRLLIHSNTPRATSAYAQQAGMLALAARDAGHEVAISAMCGALGPQEPWNGIPVFPASTLPGTYGIDQLPYFYRKWNADVALLLVDAVVVADNAHLLAGLNTAHWMPVDTDRLPESCERYLIRSGTVPIAMSEHGERVLAPFRPLYMPHAVDTSVFAPPDPEHREFLRRQLGGGFIIGMNAANRDAGRKCFFEQFEAFRRFRERHPDMDPMLYVHALLQHPYGLDLDRMLRSLGIRDSVVFPDQGVMAAMEITPAMLARNFYHALDLYSGCSAAEGFGVPLIEAQACGVQVVTSDGSAMTELCGPGSYLVKSQPLWNETHGAQWVRPSIDWIVSAYEAAASRDRDPALSREFARGYDLGVLSAGQWRLALKELETRYDQH